MITFVLGWEFTEENAARYAHKHKILPKHPDGEKCTHDSGQWFSTVCNKIAMTVGYEHAFVRCCYNWEGDYAFVFAIFEQTVSDFDDISYELGDLPPIDTIARIGSMVKGKIEPKWYVDKTVPWPGPGCLPKGGRLLWDDESDEESEWESGSEADEDGDIDRDDGVESTTAKLTKLTV